MQVLRFRTQKAKKTQWLIAEFSIIESK